MNFCIESTSLNTTAMRSSIFGMFNSSKMNSEIRSNAMAALIAPFEVLKIAEGGAKNMLMPRMRINLIAISTQEIMLTQHRQTSFTLGKQK